MPSETPSARRAPSTPLQVVTTLLAVARIVILIGGPLGLISLLFAPTLGGRHAVALSNVNFELREQSSGARLEPPKTEASVSDFKATLKGDLAMEISLRNRTRIGEIPRYILTTGVMYWIVSVALQFSRNVGAGRIFAPENVPLLRKLGTATLAAVLVRSLSSAWYYYWTWDATDAAIRARFVDISLQPPGQLGSYEVPATFYGLMQIDGGDIFWGCALLVLAEVFRYGLKLQEENELTV